MKDKKLKDALKDFKKLLGEISKEIGYKLCIQEEFWKKADPTTQKEKGHLILFTVYLLAYYSFDEWKKKLLDEPAMVDVLAKKYRELFDKKIADDDLKKGLLFILHLKPEVRRHSFEETMEEFADQLFAASNEPRTLYGKKGHLSIEERKKHHAQ